LICSRAIAFLAGMMALSTKGIFLKEQIRALIYTGILV